MRTALSCAPLTDADNTTDVDCCDNIADVSNPVALPGIANGARCAPYGAAPETAEVEDIDWNRAVVTAGGGVAATVDALRNRRGPSKRPRKEQVAIRFSPEVLAYFHAQGPGWQTRIDEALKAFIAAHSDLA